MFPVPQHLPRTGAEGLSSEISEKDPVLDLLQPLINNGESSKFTGNQVKGVRESLQKAVDDNKAQTHRLLTDNFPSISSQIQLSTSLHSHLSSVRDKVSSLEAEIDHSDSQTSFLPPLIGSLNRHFSATSSLSAAQAHIHSIKSLSRRTERIKKLEEYIWSGRSADKWVLDESSGDHGYSISEDDTEGEEILRGTRIIQAIQAKEALLKSMISDQLSEGFNAAISFSHPTNKRVQGTALFLQNEVTLQHPRTTPPPQLKSAASPHYPLSELYSALSQQGLLGQLLTSLSSRIQKDIIHPIVTSSHRVSLSSADRLSILRLEATTSTTAYTILEDIKTTLNFIFNTILPPSVDLPERRTFVSSLTNSVFQSILNSLILPTLPQNLSELPDWLNTLQQAVEVESIFSGADRIIKHFFETEAGTSWAQRRRYAVSDEVRQLILSGWGGWESTEKEQDKEVVQYVEVEIEDNHAAYSLESQDISMKDVNGAEDFGWGFEEPTSKSIDDTSQKASSSHGQIAQNEDVSMEDDGWGFDGSIEPVAGPSSSSKPPPISDSRKTEEDGWDLDPTPAIIQPEPTAIVAAPPLKPAKPAREAKRLGKKVAKVKREDEYDPWASPDPGEESQKSVNGKQYPVPPSIITEDVSLLQAVKKNTADDGWGWEDDPTPAPVNTTVAPQPLPDVIEPPRPLIRKEMREEKVTVNERYLVSTSCDTLSNIAKSLIAEIEQIQSSEFPSPSFATSILEPILFEGIKEVFILYRAFLPTHFSKQLNDVPSIAMQAFNDSIYLSSLVHQLQIPFAGQGFLEEEANRLIDLSEHIFENHLSIQRDYILEQLNEMDEMQNTNDDKVYKKDEKVIKEICHNLESLDRLIKPILPLSKYIEFISYLSKILIDKLNLFILEMIDITEIESNRIKELFKLIIISIENIFKKNQGGVIRYIGGNWLKFCYISEILQASLIDITYLIDSGSLIDFTSNELINLVKGLFANSEKRDIVIEKIENDGLGGSNLDLNS
ncbi:uncharacterized protein I206_101054 [Kwoniella pini CBS 10737]|uniref:Retrograde transport protein Dsl1 C-terminal domain-containing protein n=1 Tax=Kwoniella pini CBS 10737 TaxID=1296096 RepID=A0A1B9IC06_9TREE|nr:uncharacterized protein I206_00272 [Kwoniella pini CBS 10737]OCF52971.1 hypothetical protein I206_00272 [Kwoniella pini CBS 10737]